MVSMLLLCAVLSLSLSLLRCTVQYRNILYLHDSVVFCSFSLALLHSIILLHHKGDSIRYSVRTRICSTNSYMTHILYWASFE